MSASKIRLSAEELELMRNSQWILTKNGAIEKMVLALAELSEWMKAMLENVSPAMFQNAPKISRGEKYQGLPYLVLDYPRNFSRENILAIRTFFWWGRHCSVTLHCRGEYLSLIKQRLTGFSGTGYHISFEGDEWVHDLTAIPHQPMKRQPIPDNAAFLRIGRTCEINDWTIMEKELQQGFIDLVSLLRQED
jgi:hypothetical protein